MNETTPTIQNTLEQALIKSIDGIQKTGTELVEALYQQAPEVVEQLLLWHGVESLITFIIAFVVMVGVPLAYYKAAKSFFIKQEVQKWRDQFPFWLISGVSGAAVSIFTIAFTTNTMNIKWLKIWLAPKVYLLEYLADLVK